MLFVCWFAVYIPSVNRADEAVFWTQPLLSPLQQRQAICWKDGLCFVWLAHLPYRWDPNWVWDGPPSAATTNLSCYKHAVQTVSLSVCSSVFTNRPLIVQQLPSPFLFISTSYCTVSTAWAEISFWGKMWGFSSLLVSPQMVVYIFVSHYLVVLDNFKEEDGIKGL